MPVGKTKEIWLGSGAELPERPGQTYETADGTRGELRSRRERDRIRLTWQPQDWDQERLADERERERQRTYWRQVADGPEAAVGSNAEG
jgi:hypothetical protein